MNDYDWPPRHRYNAHDSDTRYRSLVDAKKLSSFPNVSGSGALEYIRIDRSQVSFVPDAICVWAPKLVSL